MITEFQQQILKLERENNQLQARLAAVEAENARLREPFEEALEDYKLHMSNSSYDADFASFVDEFYSTAAIKQMMDELFSVLEAASLRPATTNEKAG